MIRPYRLINASELHALTVALEQALQQWNEEYSLFPITVQLSLPAKNAAWHHATAVQAHNGTLALIETNHLTLIKQALFGEQDPCFNPSGQMFFLILLQRLFKTECSMPSSNVSESPENWFYSGSTCLLLTLSCHTASAVLVLSPDWVYQQLPKNHATSSLNTIDQALAEQKVTLNVELLPITLRLNQLMSLKAGDVIASDHLLSTPLRLTQEKQVVAHTELGLSAQHKSIILKRFS
ncbi:MAG: FliM/FliN family flagellar motor C-terminal domain-containing protein [Legionellales bacterium]